MNGRGLSVKLWHFPGFWNCFCNEKPVGSVYIPWTTGGLGPPWTGGQRWRQACQSAALPASLWP
jgi:hypothetical protein